MIQKLEQRVVGTDYGCGGASFSEVIDKVNEVIDYINSRPEEIPQCQTGFKGHEDPVGRRGRQGAAKSSSHLDLYIEGVRRSIEKQIDQLPPPLPGYYYTWELDTIRKEGSFTAIARPILKQINPEQ